MATIINTPGTQTDNSGVGVVVGVIIVLAIVVLLALYGIPALRRPASNGVNVQIPDKVNVSVQPNNGSTGASASPSY